MTIYHVGIMLLFLKEFKCGFYLFCNPYNETAYGQSVLLWLTKQLPSNIKIEDMDMEDWGWYSYIKCENEKYRVGANIFDYGNSKDKFRWSFFMEKKEKGFFQKIKEKFINKNTKKNQCFYKVMNLFIKEKNFEDLKLIESH